MDKTTGKSLNLYEKLLKIADMSGILRKNRAGYNYNYTTEDEIQAKVTSGMQKYKVFLYPSLVPNTLTVEPYTYQKTKTKKVKNETVDYSVLMNEIIVKAEVIYKWVNAENPDETIECRWAYIGQMEDASQAFGAGATYGNRYFLLKALQLATTEADPDEYRSKQKQAEQYELDKLAAEEQRMLSEEKAAVIALGTQIIKAGMTKENLMNIVAKYNGGNGNPSSIKSIDVCKTISEELQKTLAQIGRDSQSKSPEQPKKTTKKSELKKEDVE